MMPQDFDGEGGMQHDCGWSLCGYLRPAPQEGDSGRIVLARISPDSAGSGHEAGLSGGLWEVADQC